MTRLYIKLFRLNELFKRSSANKNVVLFVLLAFVFLQMIYIKRQFSFWKRDDSVAKGYLQKYNAQPYGDSYCVIYNYWMHEDVYNDTISLVTHSDIRGIYRIDRMVKRWDGAISVGVVIDGHESIGYFSTGLASSTFSNILARMDLLGLSKMLGQVSAHLIYRKTWKSPCGVIYVDPTDVDAYKTYLYKAFPKDNSWPTYNVNVARNVARIGMMTKLFTSVDLDDVPVNKFETKVRPIATSEILNKNNKMALVFRRFELDQGVDVPLSKRELLKLYQQENAFEFKHQTASAAHKIPFLEEWFAVKENTNKSSIFKTFKYSDPTWEPRFIGHNSTVPLYETGFPFGLRDQTSLIYEMCLSGFKFKVLNDVFTAQIGVKEGLSGVQKKWALDGTVYSHGAVTENYLKRLAKNYENMEEKCGQFKADDHYFFHVN